MMFEIELIAGTSFAKASDTLYDEVLKRKETGFLRFNGHTVIICYDPPISDKGKD